MDGTAELQRSQLASRFNCVPSQINYVISTRFSPEHGYIVESRRGGGGYIRIRRVYSAAAAALMHVINSIGDILTQTDARIILENLHANGIIGEKTSRLIYSALTDKAYADVPKEYRDRLRASVMKNLLLEVSASK